MTDPAAGTFELPGGHREEGESARDAGIREWQEEVGLDLPEGEFVAEFDSLTGIYRTFIFEIESEADLDLANRDFAANPDGDYFEAVAWIDPSNLTQMPDLRPELKVEAARLQQALASSVAKDARGYEIHPRSGMVSLDVPPGIVPPLPGGTSDHHVTVVYLGPDVDDDLLAEVSAVVRAIANTTTGPLTGTLEGLGTFPPSESSDGMIPVFVEPQIPGIESLRAALERFNASEFKEYRPHLTLAYLDEGDPLPDPLPPTSVSFTHLSVHRGDEVTRFPFRGCETPQERFAENVMARLRTPLRTVSSEELATRAEKANPSQRRGPDGKWRADPKWEDFHHHTDEIVAYYTPLVARAMSEVIPAPVIHRALNAAYSAQPNGKPSNPQPKPQPKPQPPVQALPPNTAAAVAAATAGLGTAVGAAAGAAAGATVSLSGAVASAAGSLAAALALIAAAPLVLAALRSVLTDLYGDAILQGAHEAAEAANGEMPPGLGDYAAELPDSFWSTWEPGHGGGAAISAQTDLADLFQERDEWVQEIASTQVARVSAAIRSAVESGKSRAEAQAAVDSIVNDPAKAQQIADSEYSRAHGEAELATFKTDNDELLRWLAMPGACPRCLENEAASPQPLASPNWPNGPIPVHPACRCVYAAG